MSLHDPATGRPNEVELLDRWCRPDGTDRALGGWLMALGFLHALPCLWLFMVVSFVASIAILPAVGLFVGGVLVARGEPGGFTFGLGGTAAYGLPSVWLASVGMGESPLTLAVVVAPAALNVGTLVLLIAFVRQPRVRYRHGSLDRFQLRERIGAPRYDALIHMLAVTYAPPDTRAP